MRWWLLAVATALLPDLGSGSLCGGTTIHLHVMTDVHTDLHVSAGPAPCEFSTPPKCGDDGCDLTCVTSTLASTDTTTVTVQVRSGPPGGPTRSVGTFKYSKELTPVVNDFGPVAGQGGDMLHMVGTRLDGAEVSVGASALTKRFGGDLLVQAVVPRLPPGEQPVKVMTPTGLACVTASTPPLKFRALVNVQSLQGLRKGSLGGGGDLVVVGQGLEGATVSLCGTTCNVTRVVPEPVELHAGEDYQALHCTPNAFLHDPKQAALPVQPSAACDLHLKSPDGQTSIFPAAWSYEESLTPTIRSVSFMGADITVNGAGFTDPSTVTVGGALCAVKTVREDFLLCTLAVETWGRVEVTVEGKGLAVPVHPAADLLTPPKPPPHIPVETFSAFTSTLCRQATLSTDCPSGWACCPVSGLAAGVGRCMAACMSGSFLSRTLQQEIYTTPPPVLA